MIDNLKKIFSFLNGAYNIQNIVSVLEGAFPLKAIYIYDSTTESLKKKKKSWMFIKSKELNNIFNLLNNHLLLIIVYKIPKRNLVMLL